MHESCLSCECGKLEERARGSGVCILFSFFRDVATCQTGGFSGRTEALEFFLLDRDVHQSPEQLLAYNVIFIDTTSVKMIICTYIFISGLIAQPVSENLYKIAENNSSNTCELFLTLI